MTKNLKQTMIGIVAGAFLAGGGVGTAAAQAESTQLLDISTVASELELSDETARELAPGLENLNEVFLRRDEHWRQGNEIQDELAAAYDQIAETLSATELREFHWLLQQGTVAPLAGRGIGGYGLGGGRGGAWARRPAMRGGRGFFGRGVPMRNMQGYPRQMAAPRGMRGGVGWNRQPYWRQDDDYPNK